MPTLPTDLRRDLDKAVVQARDLAESAARAALERLGAEAAESPPGLDEDGRRLRTALRERAKALGGGARILGFDQLVEEIAYEQWHRMLFARFLAENDLLLTPGGAPVSLADVRDLAAEKGERDPWVLAARYAAAMLPGIFRADDPANRVAYAPEDRQRLEAVLESLPASVFTADDALGWVYQFWQSKKKDEVNKKGDKIGGSDLPPVTQLFTEDYMVRFLLENSLGAWWAGRHPDSPLLKEWEYLRYRDDGTPAAGTFEGWPTTAAEVTVMDPCCGSGHFLVAAADMLRAMRIEEEGLTETDAASAVIADNLFGLELDPRCLQLAAFNLALDAWKAGGYQGLPLPNLACSGIAIKGQRDDWHRLAGGDDRMVAALDRLYDLFQDAPELGSLIDPRSAAGEGELWGVDPDELLAKLDQVLQRETTDDPAAAVFGAAAKGTAQAARLLSDRYWLVATNPPFLGRGKTSASLLDHIANNTPAGRHDLATALMERCLSLLATDGAISFVTPQNWLFLKSYEALRRLMLEDARLALIARLGEHAFETQAAAGAFVALLVAAVDGAPDPDVGMLECDQPGTPIGKAEMVRSLAIEWVSQSALTKEPDARIVTAGAQRGPRLSQFADGLVGLQTGDNPRYMFRFWELGSVSGAWSRLVSVSSGSSDWDGREWALRWDSGTGPLSREPGARIQGQVAWGNRGVLISRVRTIRATRYEGEIFDQNAAVILPHDGSHLAAIWEYCSSDKFENEVRRLDPKLNVTNATLVRVPFDLEHWQKVAAEKYPDGLPEPYSDDPTQWLFRGDVATSESPLHVAVARLLGYRWPDQEPDALDELADADGLVSLPSVGGERPADDRLRELLARAYGEEWSAGVLDRLLADVGSEGKSLEKWLIDDFFKQHTKLFNNRPFIWHIWDGRKDGFNVLVHYHRLDTRLLERLTFTVLGDWIERQRAAGDEPGAEARLAAALELQKKLTLILEGQPPNDIYVRWKSTAEQPMGWEPDLDDGVRLNIRPIAAANVLRMNPNIKWAKDRGKNPDGTERANDSHFTTAEKRASRMERGQ